MKYITKAKNHSEIVQPDASIQLRGKYLCSFCCIELPDGSIRFKGFGACPKCHRTAFSYVTLLSNPSINYSIKRGAR
jgi:hypothetical protein